MTAYTDTSRIYRLAHSFSASASDIRRQAGRVQEVATGTEGKRGWIGQAGDAFRRASWEVHGDMLTFFDGFERTASTLNALGYQFDQVNNLLRQVQQLQETISMLQSEMWDADEHQRARLRHEISQLNWQLSDMKAQADNMFHRADSQASNAFQDVAALVNRLHITERAQSQTTATTSSSTWGKVSGFFHDLWHQAEEYVGDAQKNGGVAGGVIGFFEGLGDSVVDTLKGLWEMSAFNQAYQAMRDPEGTARKAREIWEDVKHPVETFQNWHPLDKAKVIWSSVVESWDRDIVNGNAYSRSKWAGYAAGVVLQAVATDGIAAEANIAAKAVTAERRAGEVFEATRLMQETAVVKEIVKPLPSKPMDGIFFTEKDPAWSWAEKHYDEWTRSLTAEEYEAVFAYSGPNYSNINAVLRGIESDYVGRNEEYVHFVSQALQKYPVPENIIVHRGTSLAAFGMLKDLPYEKWVGRTIPEQAFMSTSLVMEGSFPMPVYMEILVPKGTPGAFIGMISEYKQEVELLLDKGAQFRIHQVVQLENGRIKIIGEIVPKGE